MFIISRILNEFFEFKNSSVDLAKVNAAKVYIRGVKVLRLLFLSLFGMTVCALFLVGGLALFHVGILFYAPWSQSTKMFLTFFFAFIYMGVAVGAFYYCLSQKRWMDIFNVKEMMEEILASSNGGRQHS